MVRHNISADLLLHGDVEIPEIVVSHGHIASLFADKSVVNVVFLTTPTEMGHAGNAPTISQTKSVSELLFV